MTEVAAPVIEQEMADWVVLGGGNSGIVGNPAHTYGFHRGANKVPSSDYSRQNDPNGSDGPYTDWDFCCAGDFNHKGNSKLRKMHADVLNGLMDGKFPMICEFIGQPWPDKPVYYWARWNGIDVLQKYTGAGHDLWSHIAWFRSKANQRAGLWVSDMPIDSADAKKVFNTDDTLDATPYYWRTDSPGHTPPGTNKGYQAETGIAEAAGRAHKALLKAEEALAQGKKNGEALGRIEALLSSGVPITGLTEENLATLAAKVADELRTDPERDGPNN